MIFCSSFYFLNIYHNVLFPVILLIALILDITFLFLYLWDTDLRKASICPFCVPIHKKKKGEIRFLVIYEHNQPLDSPSNSVESYLLQYIDIGAQMQMSLQSSCHLTAVTGPTIIQTAHDSQTDAPVTLTA